MLPPISNPLGGEWCSAPALSSGIRVARELDTLVRLYGKPACIVSDNVLGWEAAAENGQQVSLRRL